MMLPKNRWVDAIWGGEISMMVEWSRQGSSLDLEKALPADHICYVLITCGKPSPDGTVQVEVSYEGDLAVAAYLVESAHDVIDTQYHATL